jgi:hypothetical protein
VRDLLRRRAERQNRLHADAVVVRELPRRAGDPDDLNLRQERVQLGERVRRNRVEVDDDDGRCRAIRRVDDVVQRRVRDPLDDELLNG